MKPGSSAHTNLDHLYTQRFWAGWGWVGGVGWLYSNVCRWGGVVGYIQMCAVEWGGLLPRFCLVLLSFLDYPPLDSAFQT